MAERRFPSLRDWVEPAHPVQVQLGENLVSIYTLIRGQYQERIDKAFDIVSRQIGFVVATTLPVTLEIAGGKHAPLKMGAEHLKGTLFDKALSEVFSEPAPWKAPDGTYQLYLLWFNALRLKLGTAWMEPAHLVASQFSVAEAEALRVPPEVLEPAHWFEAGAAISVSDRLLIEAIDTVYPELHLVNRVALTRKLVRPEVKEPAHFRQE